LRSRSSARGANLADGQHKYFSCPKAVPLWIFSWLSFKTAHDRSPAGKGSFKQEIPENLIDLWGAWINNLKIAIRCRIISLVVSRLELPQFYIVLKKGRKS
jgi:hypothetical protein